MSSVGVAASTATGLPRLFAGLRKDRLPLWLDGHAATHGPLPSARGLVELVTASGLRGRGGGGFPAGRKLAAVASSRRRPVVVANGAEGEPISFKDKLLLRRAPHLVLDGAALAASALGARDVFVAVDSTRAKRSSIVSRALDERRDRGVSTWQLRGRRPQASSPARRPRSSAPSTVATRSRPSRRHGRSSAATAERRRSSRTSRRSRTLRSIARHGPDWFRALGTARRAGLGPVHRLGSGRPAPGSTRPPSGHRCVRSSNRQAGSAASLGAFLARRLLRQLVEPFTAQGLSLLDSELRPAGAGARRGRRSPSFRRPPAASTSPRVSRATLPTRARANAARAYTAWPRSPVRSRPSPRGRGDSRPDGAALAAAGSQAGEHAGTRTAAVRFIESSLESLPDEVELHLRGRCSGRRRASSSRPAGATREPHRARRPDRLRR